MNLIKKIIFVVLANLLFIIDIFFVILQSLLFRVKFKKDIKCFILPIGGWGYIIHSVCYLARLNKNSKKKNILYIFNFSKYNFFLNDFVEKTNIIKILLLNNFLNKISYKHSHLNILSYIFVLFYNSKNIFDLRNYFHKYNIALNDSVFPRQIKDLSRFNFFRLFYFHYTYFYYAKFKNIYPNFRLLKFFKNNFKISNIFINKSVNFYIRSKNDKDLTSKIRDFDIRRVDESINFFLEKGYNVFLTGDLKIYKNFENHKNFYSYQKFQSVPFKLYNIFFQSVIKYHISNAGGGNEVFKYNKCKILFIDYWPYWKQYPGSIMLYKKVFDKKGRIVKFSKLLTSLYNEFFLLFKEKLPIKLIPSLLVKKMLLTNYKIVSCNSNEILLACKEYYNFINNKNINIINVKKNSQLNSFFPFSTFIKKFDCNISKVNKF